MNFEPTTLLFTLFFNKEEILVELELIGLMFQLFIFFIYEYLKMSSIKSACIKRWNKEYTLKGREPLSQSSLLATLAASFDNSIFFCIDV